MSSLEYHIFLLNGRSRFFFYHVGNLVHRFRLSRKSRFIDLKIVRNKHSCVSGNFFPFLQDKDVSRHQLTVWNDQFLLFSHYRRLGFHEFFKSKKHIARSPFLNSAYDRIEDKHPKDNGSIGGFPHRKYDHTRHKQDIDERTFELSKKNQ